MVHRPSLVLRRRSIVAQRTKDFGLGTDQGLRTDKRPRTQDHSTNHARHIDLKSALVAIASCLALVAVPRASAAQPPSAWIGSWSLNVARSTYDPGPPPYKRATYTIEPWGTDGMKVIYEMVHPRGGVTHLEWMGRIDGQDYQLQGIDAHVTYAYRQVSPSVYETVVKMGGRVAAKSTVTLSPDGKTMTTTTMGVDSAGRAVVTITRYEKQQN
jgi:hypothetical protein